MLKREIGLIILIFFLNGCAPARHNIRLIYIHGMDATAPKNELKKQWDEALFGTSSAIEKAHTRMAYWGRSKSAVSLAMNEPIKRMQDEFAVRLKQSLKDNIARNNRYQEHALPTQLFYQECALPTQSLLDERLLELFSKDLDAFFFDESEHKRMCAVLKHEMVDARNSDEGIIIIAYSLGSVIAFDVLSQSSIDVKLLITIGSPLGVPLIQYWYKERYGVSALTAPRHVARWVNIANKYDIIAYDGNLSDKFLPKGFVQDKKCCFSGRNLHSAEKYLSKSELRNEFNSAWK